MNTQFNLWMIIVFAFIIPAGNLKAQSATGELVMDAMRLADALDEYADGLDTNMQIQDINAAKPVVGNILSILNYYSVTRIETLTDLQAADFNKYINELVRDVLNNSANALVQTERFATEDIKRTGDAEAGFMNANATLDALGTFLADRFKEELTIEYLDRFRTAIKDNIEFGVFFPATTTVLTENDPFMYNAFLTSMQVAVKDDINHTAEHILQYGEEHFDRLPSSLQVDHTRYLLAMFEMCNSIYSGASFISAVNDLAGSEFMSNADESTALRNYLMLASLISRSLTKNSGEWTSLEDINKLCSNEKEFKLFIGLAMMNEEKREYAGESDDLFTAIQFNGITLKDILTSGAVAQDLKGLQVYWQHAGSDFEELSEQLKNNKNVIKSGTPEEKISAMINTLTITYELISSLMPSDMIAGQYFKNISFPRNEFDNIITKLSSANQIHLHISKQEYSLAFSKLMGMIDDGTSKSEFMQIASKYGIFLTTLAEADTKEEMHAAIKTAALPVGSYRIKRTANTNISLNAFAGGFAGVDLQSGNENAFYYGFTAPVGLAFSKSFGPKGYDSAATAAGEQFPARHSVSLYFSVIDIGAITAFRVVNDSTETLPEITWNNFIAPGAFVIWGIRKSPISLGAGIQYGPQVRKLEDLENDLFARWNFRVNCTVDIPIFNFNSKPYTN